MIFRYCPKCKARLSECKARHVVCKRCGFDFYINPGPTASVILENKNGEILLVKRSIAPKKGYWDIAGGFIEFEESAEDAARREIKEELGIRVSSLRYAGSYPDEYIFRQFRYHTLNILFRAGMSRQTIHPADDVSEARWFTVRNIPWKRIAFPWVVGVLKDYAHSTHHT